MLLLEAGVGVLIDTCTYVTLSLVCVCRFFAIA